MRLLSYIDPQRSYLPTTGVGRHINGMLGALAAVPGVNTQLLFSRQFVDPGLPAGAPPRLDSRSPLHHLPARTIPWPIRWLERAWKAAGLPRADRHVAGADWVYLPEENYLPVRSVPVAVTVHDVHAFEPDLPWSNTPVHRARRRRWGVWLPPMLRRARLVAAVSEFTQRRLVQLLGLHESQIAVVGNGIDPAFHHLAAARAARPESPPMALVVGGLQARKGGEHVLAVADQLHRDRRDIPIVVAGISEPRLAAMAAHRPNIRQLGSVDDTHLHSLMTQATALLVLSEYEGFGIPVVEAMAAGLPAIVARRAALPETAGDAALVVEPHDAPLIADTLAQWARDPRSAADLISRGFRRAQSFSWSACAGRLLSAMLTRS